MNKAELASEMRAKAAKLQNAIKEDGGPPKVRLPSGEYLVGEGAEMWFEFHRAVIGMLEESAGLVETLEDA